MPVFADSEEGSERGGDVREGLPEAQRLGVPVVADQDGDFLPVLAVV
jgi:hypothetical protein